MFIYKSCTDFNYDVFSEMLHLIKVKSLGLTDYKNCREIASKITP